MSIRIISLNIERDEHLNLVLPFLRSELADVVVLYEILESDIPLIEGALGAKCFFAPTTRYPARRGPTVEGSAIFTKLEAGFEAVRYAGREGPITDYAANGNPEEKAMTQSYSLLRARVSAGREDFSIYATHFPWTPDGQADGFQRTSADALFGVLGEGDFALLGDFNAPRGGEIFARFADRFADNIPASYATSLDGSLHRAGPIPYVVDVFFSTPGYRVSDVELRFGVSDHAAVLGTVSKS